MKKKTLLLVQAIVLFIVCFGGYIAFEIWQLSYYTPSAPTLQEFSEQSEIDCQSLIAVNEGEERIYLWISSPPRFVLSSGPPAYAFDYQGKLIGWGFDSEEGYSIDKYYDQRTKGNVIELDKALRLTKIAKD